MPNRNRIVHRILFFLIIFKLFYSQSHLRSEPLQTIPSIPDVVEQWVNKQHPLPQYAEANYSPLGSSPAVDALLGDPFYLPLYANAVSEKLKETGRQNSLFRIAVQCYLAGGIPIEVNPGNNGLEQNKDFPREFEQVFGEPIGRELYNLWLSFIQIYSRTSDVFSAVSQEERDWILNNYESLFFGYQGNSEYDYFTTESGMPLKFFEIGSKIDLAELSNCSLMLASICDALYKMKDALALVALENDFIWEEKGLKLFISKRRNAIYRENADFFIHLAGNSVFANSAGGTRGERAAALHINLKGNNLFLGDKFVQGAGILGVGMLVNFGGSNNYKARAFSQGAAFFGTGTAVDYEGNNNYQLDFFGQSCAVYGSSILWNKGGNSLYAAHNGMAQAASSTLGSAFLVDGTGNSVFTLGSSSAKDSEKSMGIGQGGSAGVRHDPWKGFPSFYGGLSFLFCGGGSNTYAGSWYSQGSAYFLSCGILVNEGDSGKFSAAINSQGQGLHLAAGLLLNKGGYASFNSGWGSLGTGADRSVGMLINTGGNCDYKGADQTIGTSRKPKALGIFIDLKGGNSYFFERDSCANIQLPRAPTEWSEALFLNVGKESRYPEDADQLIRCHNCRWGISDKGVGIDMQGSGGDSYEQFLKILPRKPRVPFAFDPLAGSPKNTAFRPLETSEEKGGIVKIINEIPSSPYGKRRRLYETIDLYRFMNPGVTIDINPLLKNPENAPEDQINYAILWSLNDRNYSALKYILPALRNNEIASADARKMAIRLVGTLGNPEEAAVLGRLMKNDPSEDNRAAAAYFLAKNATSQTVPEIRSGTLKGSEAVRFALAYGLRESTLPQGLGLVIPLLDDPSFYVRRAAAMTAISMRYKPAITVLMETLTYRSLDTTVNYGDNIFTDLSNYLGVDLGTDPKAWASWWRTAGDDFEFPIPKVRNECKCH